MPDPASVAASPAPPRSSSTSPLRVVNGQVEPGCRYRVREVLWGVHKRFVVRDTATDSTIAIRTTREIADSDLLRLSWAAPAPGTARRSAHSDSPAEPMDERPPYRQCGRCRKFFASDPTMHSPAIQDWWLCEPCHDNLMATSRSTAAGSAADRARSSTDSVAGVQLPGRRAEGM